MKPTSSGNAGGTNNQSIYVKKTIFKRKQQKEFEPKDKLKQKYDRIAIRDIANLKGVKKGEAALQLVQERRKRDVMDKKDEKFIVSAEDLPWRPKVPYVIEYPPNSLSIFNAADHRRYIAIISNFLLPNPTFRFELNKLELAGLDERLREERANFNEIVISNLEKRKSLKKLSPFLETQDGSESIFVRRTKARAREILAELSFSEEVIHGFPWSDAPSSTQIPSGSFHLKFSNVFDEGELRKIVIPNPRRKCQFYMNPRVIGEDLATESATKVAIDKDETAFEYALASGAEYVMDGSTLRHFLSARHLHRDQLFVNKISIVRRVRNGISRRICVISKPVLASRMDALYVNSQFMKWCVKCELRRRYAKRRQLISIANSKLSTVGPKKSVKETETTDNESACAINDFCGCDVPTSEENRRLLSSSTAIADVVSAANPLSVKPSPIITPSPKLGGLKRRVARLSAATVGRSLPLTSSTIEGSDDDDLLASILTGMSAENTKQLKQTSVITDLGSAKEEQKKKTKCELWAGLNENIDVAPEAKHQKKSKIEVDCGGKLHSAEQLSDTSATSSGFSLSSLFTDTFNSLQGGSDTTALKMNSNNVEDDVPRQRKYRYASIALDGSGKHTLLMRTTQHGTDQEGKNVSVVVKNEYLPEAGAQKLSTEELIWNYVTALTKGAVEHIRLHMHPRTGHCVQLKRADPKRMFSEQSNETKQLVWTRIQRLCRLMDELNALDDVGEYLLVPELIENSGNGVNAGVVVDVRMRVLAAQQNCDREVRLRRVNCDTLDANRENYSNNSWPEVVNAAVVLNRCALYEPPAFVDDVARNWRGGIDEHFPLVWHVVQGRIPGSLFPSDRGPRQEKNIKKNPAPKDSNNASTIKTGNGSGMNKSKSRRLRRNRLQERQRRQRERQEETCDKQSSNNTSINECGRDNGNVASAGPLQQAPGGRGLVSYQDLQL